MGNGQFGFYLVGSGPPNLVHEGKPGRDYDRVLYKVGPGRFPSHAESGLVTDSNANRSYSVTPPSYTKAAAGLGSAPCTFEAPTGFGRRPYYSSPFPRKYDSKSNLAYSRSRFTGGGSAGVSDFPRSRNFGERYQRPLDDFHLNYSERHISPVGMASTSTYLQGRPASAATAATKSRYAFHTSSNYNYNPTTSAANAITYPATQCLPEPPQRSECGVPETSFNVPPIRPRCNPDNKFTKGCQTDPSPWILYENLNNGKFMAVTKNAQRPRECCGATPPKAVDGSTSTRSPSLGRFNCPINCHAAPHPVIPQWNAEAGTDPVLSPSKPSVIVKSEPPKLATVKSDPPSMARLKDYSPPPKKKEAPKREETPPVAGTALKKSPKPKNAIAIPEIPSVPLKPKWSSPWGSKRSKSPPSRTIIIDETPSPPILKEKPDTVVKSAQTGKPTAVLKRHPSQPGPSSDGPILMANRRSVHNLKRSLSQTPEIEMIERPESPKTKGYRSAHDIRRHRTRVGGEIAITIPSSLSLKNLLEGQVKVIPKTKTKDERIETQEELNVRLSKNIKVQKMHHEAKKSLTSAQVAARSSQSALKKKPSKPTTSMKKESSEKKESEKKESEKKAAGGGGTERKRSIRFKDVPPSP